MAGYDEDFWGEDFLEGEEFSDEPLDEGVDTERGGGDPTEVAAGTESTEGTEGAEGAEVDIDGEGTEGTEGGEGEDEGFSPTFWHALRRRHRKGWTRALRGNLRGF